MKAKIEGSTSFKPFDLTITVESVEELKTLWVVANAGAPSLNNLNTAWCGDVKELHYDLWSLIDNKCKELGLK